MYLTVRRYRKVEGDRNQMMETIKTGFVPLIAKIDGFIDYYCFLADDGALMSVSVYRDQRGADESVRAAAKFVEQQLTTYLPEKPEVMAGEVLAQRHVEKQQAA